MQIMQYIGGNIDEKIKCFQIESTCLLTKCHYFIKKEAMGKWFELEINKP